jgi:hypothetical protein
MFRFRLLIVGLIMIATFATHPVFTQSPASPDGPRYRLRASQPSPRGELSVELLVLAPTAEVDDGVPQFQQWVVDRDHRANRAKLYEGDQPTRASFSPDGFYLALQSTAGPQAGGSLLLFKHREGVRFDPVGGLEQALWDYCRSRHSEAGPVAPETRHSEIVAWGSDNNSLLVALSGAGAQGRLSEWLVACDLMRTSPTLDLNLLNRGWPQTQNLAPDALARLEFAAGERANERLLAAFHLLTQPSGGEELIPQPGDPVAATPETSTFGTPTPTPTPVPPSAHKVRSSVDGSALLYQLRQLQPGNQPARNWFCLFDMQTSRPSMDLEVLNRGALGQAAAGTAGTTVMTLP